MHINIADLKKGDIVYEDHEPEHYVVLTDPYLNDGMNCVEVRHKSKSDESKMEIGERPPFSLGLYLIERRTI